MGTLASNRKGYIVGSSASDWESALSATTGTAYDSQSSNAISAIQFFFSSGRGGGTYRLTRTFIHFDTSGISGGSSFQLVVTSVAGGESSGHNTIAVNHDAGTGNGGELANADFNNVIKGTKWSSAHAWPSSGQITFTLNAAAATQIINNDDFNVALILESDCNEEEEGPEETFSNGIAFGSAINLTYTDPASGFTHKINSLAAASIGKVNTVATANIGKINTVD